MALPTIMGKSPGEVCLKSGLGGIVVFSVPTALKGFVPIVSLNTLSFMFFFLLSVLGFFEWKRENSHSEDLAKLTNEGKRIENNLRQLQFENQILNWMLDPHEKIEKKKSEDTNRAKLLKPIMELAEKTGEKNESDMEELVEVIKRRIFEIE